MTVPAYVRTNVPLEYVQVLNDMGLEQPDDIREYTFVKNDCSCVYENDCAVGIWEVEMNVPFWNMFKS